MSQKQLILVCMITRRLPEEPGLSLRNELEDIIL